MNKFLLGIGALLLSQANFAQNEDDALRYSQTFFGGTARNTGMAGAMTAFGGDFSVVTKNPAGLARIRKTNFSSTLNIENNIATTDFYGKSTKDQATIGNLSNISYVKAYELKPKDFNNWYSVQLGMGVTRIKSFQQRIDYSGNADSSILHSFINEAYGIPDSLIIDAKPFSSGLAYAAYAIDPVEDGSYTTDFTSGVANHNRSITRKGGMNEYSFSLSGNYANKLYVGASFNMTKVKYSETFQHQEFFSDTSLWLQGINYTGTLDIDGWGYGFRVGAIYLPLEWLSVGLAIQTPTTYNLSDSWGNDMNSITDDGDIFVDESIVPNGKYDYQVKTPFRGNVSLGVVLEKYGSIGVELEYVDYSAAGLKSKRYSKEPYSFIDENFQIENIYRSVINYKIGAEAKITSQMYLRGGFAFYDSPFKEGKGNAQNPTVFYTGGIGYNWGKFYTDASCVMHKTTTDYFAYDPTIVGSKATIDQKDLRFKLSIGFRLD